MKEFIKNYLKLKAKDTIKSLLITGIIYLAIYLIFDLSWWVMGIIFLIDVVLLRIVIKLILFRYFKIFKYVSKAKEYYDKGKDIHNSLPSDKREMIIVKSNEAIDKLKNIKLKNYGRKN